MIRLPKFLHAFTLMICLAACQTNATQPVPVQVLTHTPNASVPTVTAGALALTCKLTLDDGLSPSYKPNAPFRSVVGHGHILSGVVLSSRDCKPIANAQIELWTEYAGRGHPDEARATLFTDSLGRYRFECDLPEHIHMRISAPGYIPIAQNSYHPEGQAEGTFNIVLASQT